MADKDYPAFSLPEAIELLLERRRHGDQIYLNSPAGLRFLHLRFEQANGEGGQFFLMFKRCPEIKPFYPKIRDWFAGHSLDWKDKTVDGKRYMAAELSLNAADAETLIQSAKTDIFGVVIANISSADAGLSMKIMGFKHPYICMGGMFISLVCMAMYLFYQVFNFKTISMPSLSGMKSEEWLLVGAILICIRAFEITKPKSFEEWSDEAKPVVKWKKIRSVVFFTGFFVLGFSTQ